MCLSRAARFLLSAGLVIYASSWTVAGSSHCPDKSSRPASSFVEEFDGICYEFHLERLTWKDANASCEQRRGALVTIDSSAKQEFLAGILQSDRALMLVWIGAKNTRARGAWIWEQTGQPLAYTNWATNPKNHEVACGSMGREDKWRWQSVHCESSMFTHSYICQYDGRSAGGLLSDPGNVIGLAVGLVGTFCVLIAIVGTLAWIRRRRRMRAERRRSFSSDSTEQKISNIDGSCKYDLNVLNICPAPPAYGQVTTLQTVDGGELPSSAAQPLLYGEQQQQSELSKNDLLASNLASHSSQASKLQDKCLSELIAADTSSAAAPAAAADGATTDDAAPTQPVAVMLVDDVSQCHGSQAASTAHSMPTTPTADQPAAAEPADSRNEEAEALLESNDLS